MEEKGKEIQLCHVCGILGEFLQNRFGLFFAALLGLTCFVTVILILALSKINLTEKGLFDHNIFQIVGTFIMAVIYVFIWFVLGIKVLKALRRRIREGKSQ